MCTCAKYNLTLRTWRRARSFARDGGAGALGEDLPKRAWWSFADAVSACATQRTIVDCCLTAPVENAGSAK